MKWVITRILLAVLGIILLALVLTLEMDGVRGFLLAWIGLSLFIIGLTLRGLIRLFIS